MPTVQRQILLKWTVVVDPVVVGYNVYLVTGAPPNQTKTLIQFVSGRTTTQFLYNIDEEQQYQFEIRATDAPVSGNESAPLELFFPDGRGLATPTRLTPDGKPMLFARDVQYVTALDFLDYPNGLKLTTNSPLYISGMLDLYLKTASGMIDRICRRHFSVQTKDEIYPSVRIGQDFPKLMTVFLQEKPVQNIISINLQVLKYFIPVALDYLMLDSDAGFYNIVPMLSGGYTGFPVPQVVEGMLARVWTRYTFGYDELPEEIKTATAIIATKLISLPSQNPVSAASVRFGRNFQLNWSKENDPVMDIVEDLLRPHKKFGFGRPSLPY